MRGSLRSWSASPSTSRASRSTRSARGYVLGIVRTHHVDPGAEDLDGVLVPHIPFPLPQYLLGVEGGLAHARHGDGAALAELLVVDLGHPGVELCPLPSHDVTHDLALVLQRCGARHEEVVAGDADEH